MMKKSIFKFFSLVALSLCAATSASYAAAIADSTCDPSYMESLESRAWLEAQREITQNQNLIAKPDSVLAYSCFDQFAGVLGQAEENSLFSGPNNKLGTAVAGESILKILLGEYGKDNSLLATPLAAHFALNYGGKNVGKKVSGPLPPVSGLSRDQVAVQMLLRGTRGGPENQDNTYTADLAFNNTSYNCDVMQRVWFAAKCADFIEKGHDGFFTFKEYSEGNDKRELPSSCGAALAQWNTEIGRSGFAPGNTETPWVEDEPNTYSQLSDASECGSTQPIDTGIMVQLSGENAQPFPEKFCIQPGCYYNGSACVESLSGS